MALAKPDERASAVGAANTLWYEGEVLRATNTDVEGFLANLDPPRRAGTAAWKTRWCSAPAAAPAPWCLRCWRAARAASP